MSQQPVRLIKTLSMWQVVVMGLAYLTPMAVFDTFAIVGDITEGRVATAYLLNQPPDKREFTTDAQYQALRDQFLAALLNCMADPAQ